MREALYAKIYTNDQSKSFSLGLFLGDKIKG